MLDLFHPSTVKWNNDARKNIHQESFAEIYSAQTEASHKGWRLNH